MLPALLDAWSDGDDAIVCLVPDGVASGALDLWTAGNVPHPGHPLHRGRLTLYTIPFVAQDVYDRLLWSCAVNFVRGEDSFVRAQWAARPCAWHIYPQVEGAHWAKLEAFLDRYAAGLDAGSAVATRRFWRAWNGAADEGAIDDAWARVLASPSRARARTPGAGRLTSPTLPDLAAGLVKIGVRVRYN